jgi:hypothetical protein
MSFFGQSSALRIIEITERGAHVAPSVFIIGHLAKEGNARPLQGLCGLDAVEGVVEWCA